MLISRQLNFQDSTPNSVFVHFWMVLCQEVVKRNKHSSKFYLCITVSLMTHATVVVLMVFSVKLLDL